ncbi:hypothetical protein AYI69_g10281 [Smittium culicis]|uniref:Uncharacterized protein n=1 Tax=Smittium culicis TaxID=133412 RepID=A0A1R1X6Z2_9FUNG|nr:hypothetical protein AYI69_g10281 [Smittium culicis]
MTKDSFSNTGILLEDLGLRSRSFLIPGIVSTSISHRLRFRNESPHSVTEDRTRVSIRTAEFLDALYRRKCRLVWNCP